MERVSDLRNTAVPMLGIVSHVGIFVAYQCTYQFLRAGNARAIVAKIELWLAGELSILDVEWSPPSIVGEREHWRVQSITRVAIHAAGSSETDAEGSNVRILEELGLSNLTDLQLHVNWLYMI
jgi:hypothetical protein